MTDIFDVLDRIDKITRDEPDYIVENLELRAALELSRREVAKLRRQLGVCCNGTTQLFVAPEGSRLIVIEGGVT